jgi:hypothetical protein
MSLTLLEPQNERKFYRLFHHLCITGNVSAAKKRGFLYGYTGGGGQKKRLQNRKSTSLVLFSGGKKVFLDRNVKIVLDLCLIDVKYMKGTLDGCDTIVELTS